MANDPLIRRAIAPPASIPAPPPVDVTPVAAAGGPEGGGGGHREIGTFESFKSRDFRLLWAGTSALGFSQWGQQIGLNWLVYVLTDSAVELGKVAFFGGILSLVLGPFAGLLADRYPRRAIMIGTSAVGSLQAAILAGLVLTDAVQVWHCYVFAIVSSIMNTATGPAQQAYVHDISEPETLTNAIALNSVAQNVSRIIGPPLTGVIVAWNVGAAFIMVAGMRGISMLTAMALRSRKQAARERGVNPLVEVFDGFRYLASEDRLRWLLAMNALPSLFVIPYLSFMPIFAKQVFHGGSREYGWLVSMLAIGSIIGLLSLARAGDVRHKGRYLLGGEIMYVVLVVSFTRMDVFLAALACLATAGLFHSVARAVNTSMFQTNVRSDMRGRGMAAFNMGSGLTPIGTIFMTFLVTRFGVQDGVMLSQLVCGVGVIMVMIFGRTVRQS